MFIKVQCYNFKVIFQCPWNFILSYFPTPCAGKFYSTSVRTPVKRSDIDIIYGEVTTSSQRTEWHY